MKEDLFQELLEQYYKLSNTIVHFKNKTFSFDGSEPVLTASMHLIDMIVKHPGANMTELAEHLGITKGAVSQMASTLEKKKIITRQRLEEDSRNVSFELTNEGWKIYNGHEQMHKDLYAGIHEILESYSEEDVAKVRQILKFLADSMECYEVI